MNKNTISNVIAFVQKFLVLMIIFVVTSSLLALVLFDTLAGTGVALSFTNGNLTVSVFLSLATSGLLLSLMFMTDKKVQKSLGIEGAVLTGMVVAMWGGIILDIVLDAFGADYIGYGRIVDISLLPKIEGSVLWIYRILIGVISSIGEKLAMGILMGMPILEDILKKALPDGHRSPKTTPRNQKSKTSQKSKSQTRASQSKRSSSSDDKLVQERLALAQSRRQKTKTSDASRRRIPTEQQKFSTDIMNEYDDAPWHQG